MDGTQTTQQGEGTKQGVQGTQQPTQAQQIDYGRVQQMLDDTLAKNEDAALKSYFKQQGLTAEEAQQAMNTFKQQKAANHPDVGALQSQLAAARKAVSVANVKNEAMMAAFGLGLDAKTIPYVLKMADLSNAVGTDGVINQKAIKSAIDKVLEDIPALKPSTQAQQGFVMGAFGGTGKQGSQTQSQEEMLNNIFGIRKR
ncbi:MAG: hypothetical protein ACI4C1_08610 [Lachnospiraceae bacterium]